MNISRWFDFGRLFWTGYYRRVWITYLISVIFVFLSSNHLLDLPEPQIEQTWLKKQRNNFRTEFFKSAYCVPFVGQCVVLASVELRCLFLGFSLDQPCCLVSLDESDWVTENFLLFSFNFSFEWNSRARRIKINLKIKK